jgi:hypothetical protein
MGGRYVAICGLLARVDAHNDHCGERWLFEVLRRFLVEAASEF